MKKHKDVILTKEKAIRVIIFNLIFWVIGIILIFFNQLEFISFLDLASKFLLVSQGYYVFKKMFLQK